MSEKTREGENPMYSATPFDDAFRTMESECDDLLCSRGSEQESNTSQA